MTHHDLKELLKKGGGAREEADHGGGSTGGTAAGVGEERGHGRLRRRLGADGWVL